MEVKKNPEKDVRKKRFDFSLIGLSVSLLMVFLAFEYRTPPPKVVDLGDYVYDEEIQMMENTVQQKKPPPPPPPPELVIVDDEVEIDDDQPDFEDNEVDQDTEIEAYEEEEEPPVTDEVFEMFAVQEQAKFKGNFQKFLYDNLSYPDAANRAGQEGTVVVRFTVDKQGNLRDVHVISPPLGFGLEEEAMRVVKLSSGNWEPAKQRDQPVNVRFQVPINFQLY